jgi:hypothetical protein
MAASSFIRRIAAAGSSVARSRVLSARPAINVGFSALYATAFQRPLAAASARGMAGASRMTAFRSLAAQATSDEPASAASTETTLFVGNLSWTVDDSVLQDVFASHNPVSCKVIVDRETGRSKGIAFVNFGSEEDATKARDALNGKV